MLREYYRLTKPGIVYGNSLHYIGGALLGAATVMSWSAAVGGLVGTMLVIASACVVNNYIDRDIDRYMKRTKKRGFVTGQISLLSGSIFALILLMIGMATLAVTTNLLTVTLGLIAYLMYAVVYTASKRLTVHSTLIGTIPGALPAVAGYTALIGQMDLTAWLLFAVIGLWQLPHFYAIGVFRLREYRAAKLPILSTKLSAVMMRRVIIGTTALYVASVVVLGYYSLHWISSSVFIGLAVWWLVASSLQAGTGEKWARSVFGYSLVVTLLFPVIMLINLGLGYIV